MFSIGSTPAARGLARMDLPGAALRREVAQETSTRAAPTTRSATAATVTPAGPAQPLRHDHLSCIGGALRACGLLAQRHLRHKRRVADTVDIRVSVSGVERIASAKTLAEVRELEGGNRDVGVPGMIGRRYANEHLFLHCGLRPSSDSTLERDESKRIGGARTSFVLDPQIGDSHTRRHSRSLNCCGQRH